MVTQTHITNRVDPLVQKIAITWNSFSHKNQDLSKYLVLSLFYVTKCFFSRPSTRTMRHFLSLPKSWCSIYGKLTLEYIYGVLQRIIAMINRLSILINRNRSAAKISQNMIFEEESDSEFAISGLFFPILIVPKIMFLDKVNVFI